MVERVGEDGVASVKRVVGLSAAEFRQERLTDRRLSRDSVVSNRPLDKEHSHCTIVVIDS